jgi:exonuclease III
MTGNNKNLSILTLNINCLNAPIKRHRIANYGKKKKDPNIYCLQEIHLTQKKEINTSLESKSRKRFSKQMDPINGQE